VLDSDYPAEKLEVLVCDGMSTDKTREIVGTISQAHPRVRLIDNLKQTTPFALNLGIRSASHPDVVIILGAHSEIAKDYVSLCVEDLQIDPAAGCVGGLLQNVNEDRTSERIAIAMSSGFGVGSAHFRTGQKEGYVDTVAFGAYRKEVFEKAGLFDEELTRNQDDEFNYRVIKNGFKIRLDSRIRSKYYVRAAFGKLWRQYFQYGYWKVYVNRKHKAVTSMRQLVPPGFVAFLFSAVFALLWMPWICIWSGILGLYLLGGIVSALKGGAGLSGMPGVVAAFFILHVGYGLGYIKGIFHFVLLGKQPGTAESRLSR
jgi:cellulose synthase/poly-beta-1,6-N-acetylglucosamine synthase-like glycosyltransferase